MLNRLDETMTKAIFSLAQLSVPLGFRPLFGAGEILRREYANLKAQIASGCTDHFEAFEQRITVSKLTAQRKHEFLPECLSAKTHGLVVSLV